MSNIKWIKLSTAMFEDEKIRLIEQMPDADTILIIWVRLLSQAGKTNASGYIYLSENIPYTDEMLATIFNRPVSTVRLALRTFEQFGMISIDDDHFIEISNWEKHQNVEGMERVRKLNAERNQRYRERKKQTKIETKNNDSDVSVTSRDGTDIELEVDIDKERDIKKDRKKKKEAKDFTAKIKDLLPVFSSITDFNKLSKEYWDAIRDTRKTGTVAESVIYRNIKNWTRYDPIVVEYALKEHVDNHVGKKEEYTIGIMRNTTVEEVKQAGTKKQRQPFGHQPRKKEQMPEWFDEHRKQVDQYEKQKEQQRSQSQNVDEEQLEREMQQLINSVKSG